MTDSHENKHEVVRYISKTPKGWVTRGMLLRVVSRTPKGNLRVSIANGKNPGAPQYINESDVEPVGQFADDSELFKFEEEMNAALEQTEQASQNDDDTVTFPSTRLAQGPVTAVLKNQVDEPPIDLRQLVRNEVNNVLPGIIAEMVRDEISKLVGR